MIEALAARNPEWVQFADRMLAELLIRHETAIAMIGEIKDGPLINGVWVGEIGGGVKIYFALMDDRTKEIEDYAEYLVGLLASLRECVDGDERVLWDGVAPVAWRPATQAEYNSFVPPPVEHLLWGWGLRTKVRIMSHSVSFKGGWMTRSTSRMAHSTACRAIKGPRNN